MSNEVQEALDRLFDPAGARPKNRLGSEAAEDEAAQLFELAERVGRLRKVRAPRRLREHGLEFILSQPVPPSRRRLWLVPPPERRHQLVKAFTQVAASAAAVLVLGFSAASASTNSLPDSPLYNVRLFTEDVQVALAPAEHRPQIFVSQAQRHTDESLALLEQGRAEVAQRLSDDAVRRIDSANNAAASTSDPESARTVVAEAATGVIEVRDRAKQEVESQRATARLAAQATPTVSGPIALPPPARTPAAEPTTNALEPTAVASGPTSAPTVDVAAPGSTSGFTTIGATSSPAPTNGATGTGEQPAVVNAPQTPFVPIATTGESTPLPTATSIGVSAPAPTFLPIGATSTGTPSSIPAATPTTALPPTATRTPTATVVPTAIPATASPTRTPTGQLEAPSGGFTPIVIGPQGSGS